jgi:hypothetical protein
MQQGSQTQRNRRDSHINPPILIEGAEGSQGEAQPGDKVVNGGFKYRRRTCNHSQLRVKSSQLKSKRSLKKGALSEELQYYNFLMN